MSAEKLSQMTETVYDLLASNLHTKSEFHNIFVRRSIANSIYDQAPKLYSGLISVNAKNYLTEGGKRSSLCKEHPYPRTRTTKDLLETFETLKNRVTEEEIKIRMSQVLEHGCKVHYVLTEENQKLYPFQQNYSLSEQEIYDRAGVKLILDEKLDIIPYIYTIDNIDYKMSQDELSKTLNMTKYKVLKMIKSGEIQKRENIPNN